MNEVFVKVIEKYPFWKIGLAYLFIFNMPIISRVTQE